MRVWPLPLVLAMLGACAVPTDRAPTATEAEAAEAFVVTSLLAQFPDYPAPEAAARCIRQHATDQEVLLLAGEVGTQRDRPRRTLGVVIAQRPETQACFASANVPALR